MKKSFLYLLGLIAMMVISCTEDAIVEQSSGELRITGSLASDSRTTFVEGDGVIETHWNVGDLITLYNGDENDREHNNLKYKATVSGKTTEFQLGGTIEMPSEEGKTIYACYPHTSTYEGYAMTHRIPSNYSLYGSSITPFFYGQGTIRNNQLNLSFKHFYSYLRINISAQEIRELFAAYLEKPWAGQESDYDLTQTKLMIRSTEDISLSQGYFNPVTHEITNKMTAKYLYFNLDDIDYASNETYTYIVPILAQPAGAELTVELHFQHINNYGSQGASFQKKVPEGGLKVGNVYTWSVLKKADEGKLAELLKELYEQTNGSGWTYQTNWLSDKPLEDWEGVYLNTNGKFNSLWLASNNLTGPFPEVIADIMDYSSGYIDLWGNYLYGYIPEKVKNHKRWQDWGWYIVPQLPYEPIIQDYNLYPANMQVEDLFENESTVKDLYEIFKQNELTQVIKGYSNTFDGFLRNEFGANRVNLHLDYQSKGLGTLIFTGESTPEEEQALKQTIRKSYGDVEGVRWLKGNSPIKNHLYSLSYFFDKTGKLVYIGFYNYSQGHYEKLKYINEHTQNSCSKHLSDLLGTPADHPEFTMGFYTSTDFSKDGEVVQLQKADIGNGINLIFMGNAFVDKDMEDGGYYEQFMREAMESFFSYEPYKTFRNRFNVYTVKVVSLNEEWAEGAQHALNIGNYYDYAIKVPNPHNQSMKVTIFANPKCGLPGLERSNCRSNSVNDGFVSFINDSDPDGSTHMHETGGHGIGKLQDEYIEDGLEDLQIPEDTKILWDNRWEQYGRGANVDWRSDRETVRWAHFLKDSRYDNEGLGIYEGAWYGKGAYRPSEHSMMRYKNAPFNAPSREAIYKRIMQLSEGDGWIYDYEEFVKYDEINRNTASRAAIKPLTEAEQREYAKKHCPPTFIKGTWRDAMNNGKQNIIVPLR